MFFTRQIVAIVTLLALLPTAAFAQTTAAPTSKPVYLIASMKVSDLKTYVSEYGQPVTPMLIKAGGKLLVGAPSVEVLEGSYGANWTVVVQFPSEQAAKGWYQSDEYRKFIGIRQGLTDQKTAIMVLAPQFELPPR